MVQLRQKKMAGYTRVRLFSMFLFVRLVPTPRRQRELMEGRDVEPPAVVLEAELCLKAAYLGTCPKEKVAVFDGNDPGKDSFLRQIMHVDGWEQV